MLERLRGLTDDNNIKGMTRTHKRHSLKMFLKTDLLE